MIMCDDIVAFVGIVQFLRPHNLSYCYKMLYGYTCYEKQSALVLGFLTSIEFQDDSFGLEVMTVVVGYFKSNKVNCRSSKKLYQVFETLYEILKHSRNPLTKESTIY